MKTIMKQKLQRLDEICTQYQNAIPVAVAAEFVGTTAAALRSALRCKTCPFGYAWQSGERSGYCIPTLAFYVWVTSGQTIDPDIQV